MSTRWSDLQLDSWHAWADARSQRRRSRLERRERFWMHVRLAVLAAPVYVALVYGLVR